MTNEEEYDIISESKAVEGFQAKINESAEYSVQQAIDIIENRTDVKNPDFNVYFLTALELSIAHMVAASERDSEGISKFPLAMAFISGIFFAGLNAENSIEIARNYFDYGAIRGISLLVDSIYDKLQVYCENHNSGFVSGIAHGVEI